MSTANLSVTLSLDDQLTGALQKTSAAINKISRDVEDFGRSLKSTGRELSGLGRDLSFFGAGAIAPFALALDRASKSSDEVAHTLRVVDSISQQFYLTISKSVLPLVKDFAFQLNNLLTWFNGLSQSTRDFIIQGAIITGVFLTLGGALTFIIGKMIGLAANIALLAGSFMAFAAANIPLIATIGLIGVLIGLMIKFKGVADTIISTFEVLFRFLMNGFHTINAAIGEMVSGVLNGLAAIVDGLAKIPGPTQESFQKMSQSIRGAAESAHGFATLEMNEIIDNAQKIGNIFQTGEGEWSRNFDNVKTKVVDLINKIKELGTAGNTVTLNIKNTFKDFVSTSTSVLGTLSSALQGAAAQNKKFAVAAQAAAIGLAIINTAQGATKAYADWGWPLGAIFAALITAAGGIQIATIASQSFAVGTPNVPNDMLAQVHQGETIVPSTFADAIRRGDLTLGGPGGGGGGDIINNFYINNISSEDHIRELVERVGYEMQRTGRMARGI